MKELISKRASEVGLTPQAPRDTAAPFNPRASHRAYGDYSRIAGLRDATMNDPLTDLGSITSRQRSDYDYGYLPRRDEPQRTFAMSKAAVASVVDECMKQIANVLDKKMLAWNALGWLDVRKGMEKTLELVIANKTKAYPDGYKGDAVPVKVVEGDNDAALAACRKIIDYWELGGNAAYDTLKGAVNLAYAATGKEPKHGLPALEADGIGEHMINEALPKREQIVVDAAKFEAASPLGLTSLTKGMWFTAGKKLASLLCKVDRVENETVFCTVTNGDWPIAFDRITGACLPEGYLSSDQARDLRINFVGPWKQGLAGYTEHLEYANEKIAERGE